MSEEKVFAAIGKAAFKLAESDPDQLENLCEEACKHAPDNRTLSAVTKLFEDAGEPGWLFRRHQARRERDGF